MMSVRDCRYWIFVQVVIVEGRGRRLLPSGAPPRHALATAAATCCELLLEFFILTLESLYSLLLRSIFQVQQREICPSAVQLEHVSLTLYSHAAIVVIPQSFHR